MGDWTVADIPDQRGRTAVVTGANSGIGYWAALALARRGAVTVLACRDVGKGKQAAARIEAAAPEAEIRVVALDLASLASVHDAAEQITARCDRLDLLINNAGLMMPPAGTTADGFELQFGTNHLGHFALTGALLPRMLSVDGSRVVTVSSNVHRTGRVDVTDLNWQRRRYRRMASYAQSKLANLMFTYELQRRLVAAGAATAALAAHPGTSTTQLTRHFPGVLHSLNQVFGGLYGQSAEMGALPTLRAASDPAARGGEYYGPGGLMQMMGHPKRVESVRRSHDTAVQQRLWQESTRLTGVTFPV